MSNRPGDPGVSLPEKRRRLRMREESIRGLQSGFSNESEREALDPLRRDKEAISRKEKWTIHCLRKGGCSKDPEPSIYGSGLRHPSGRPPCRIIFARKTFEDEDCWTNYKPGELMPPPVPVVLKHTEGPEQQRLPYKRSVLGAESLFEMAKLNYEEQFFRMALDISRQYFIAKSQQPIEGFLPGEYIKQLKIFVEFMNEALNSNFMRIIRYQFYTRFVTGKEEEVTDYWKSLIDYVHKVPKGGDFTETYHDEKGEEESVEVVSRIPQSLVNLVHAKNNLDDFNIFAEKLQSSNDLAIEKPLWPRNPSPEKEIIERFQGLTTYLEEWKTRQREVHKWRTTMNELVQRDMDYAVEIFDSIDDYEEYEASSVEELVQRLPGDEFYHQKFRDFKETLADSTNAVEHAEAVFEELVKTVRIEVSNMRKFYRELMHQTPVDWYKFRNPETFGFIDFIMTESIFWTVEYEAEEISLQYSIQMLYFLMLSIDNSPYSKTKYYAIMNEQGNTENQNFWGHLIRALDLYIQFLNDRGGPISSERYSDYKLIELAEKHLKNYRTNLYTLVG